MLTSSVPTDAWISGGISPDRRERADRRYSTFTAGTPRMRRWRASRSRRIALATARRRKPEPSLQYG